MGRPAKQLDKDEFESLCAIQCTEAEICDFFGITDKTLTAWCQRVYCMSFSEVFAQKRGLGKISLRRTQWRMAQRSVPMAIFLGKNMLGQKDKVESDVQFNPGSAGNFTVNIGPPEETDENEPDEAAPEEDPDEDEFEGNE